MRKVNYKVITPSEYKVTGIRYITDSEGNEYRLFGRLDTSSIEGEYLVVNLDSNILEDHYKDMSEFMINLFNSSDTEQRVEDQYEDTKYLFKSITPNGVEYIIEFYSEDKSVKVMTRDGNNNWMVSLSSRRNKVNYKAIENAFKKSKKQVIVDLESGEDDYDNISEISYEFSNSRDGSISTHYDKIVKLSNDLKRLLNFIYLEDEGFLDLKSDNRVSFLSIRGTHHTYIMNSVEGDLEELSKKYLELSDLSSNDLRKLYINYTSIIKYLYDLYDAFTDYEDVLVNSRVKSSFENLLKVVEEVKDLRDDISKYY